MDRVFESDFTFPRDVERVFMDAHSARLARALGNSPRNAQKWVNGSEGAPPHAREFVREQLAILNRKDAGLHYGVFKTRIEMLLEAGLHKEVVASMLSKAYEELMDKPIR